MIFVIGSSQSTTSTLKNTCWIQDMSLDTKFYK